MKKWISRIITVLIIAILIGIVVHFYQRYYFNDFSKAYENSGCTAFYKDSNVKYNGENSYCIDTSVYNDALFFKEIQVEKDTPYRISCMVKTENIESDKPETAGACISLMDSTDQTIPIQGTNDWQKITLLVDSKNEDSLKICFRLGGYDGYSKGKVWFSDIHVEKGKKDDTTDWNVVCFLIDNVNVNLDGKKYAYSLTNEDKNLLKTDLERFANTCKDFSNGLMTVNYDVVEIQEPLTSLSYDNENYYYVAPKDVKSLIDKYVSENEYDHIFIGIRMGTPKSEIPVNEWIGLGSMRYNSIGFSDIRMPNDLKNSTMYKYDVKNDVFPEEVFVHEFLHSLERNLVEREYNFPALHDNEKFGYVSENKTGLKQWYKDYMQCDIDSNIGKTGLSDIAYKTKPVQMSDFNTCDEVEFEVKPKNIFEIVVQLYDNLKKAIINKDDNIESEKNYITVTTD